MNTRSLLPLLAVGVLLAGCSADAPAPAASSVAPSEPAEVTPWGGPVDAPADEAEALETGEVVATEFFRVADEIYADGGADEQRIDAVSTDPALSVVYQAAAGLEENRVTITGATGVEIVSGYAAPAGDTPFGAVAFQVCTDFGERAVTEADGSPGTAPTQTRALVDLDVVYSADLEAWRVSTYTGGSESC